VDQPLIERRAFNRFGRPSISHLHAVLRPGRVVWLVNLSSGGALVEGRRPLRPGSRVYLHLSTEDRCVGRAGHVLRCAVASLAGADGVRYHGAVQFDDECQGVWEELTRDGYAVPAGSESRASISGHVIPTGVAGMALREEGGF
jgi:hypothetical protein